MISKFTPGTSILCFLSPREMGFDMWKARLKLTFETDIFRPLSFGDLVEGKTDVSGNRKSTKGELYLTY